MNGAARLWRMTYLRYFGASVASLGVDVAMFLLLCAGGMPPAAAAAAGYCGGIVSHWLISSRLVFADGLRAAGAERGRQQLLFLSTALAGLAITIAIVGLADVWGLDARLAKLVAIVVSFQATYLLRSKLVFG